MVRSSSESDLQLKEMLSVLWDKKWLILLITGLCTLLGFVYANYSKPLYKTDIIVAPPLASSVIPLNETDLKLFDSENLFAIFTSVLTSESTKYSFFEKNVLPQQAKANNKTNYSYKAYKSFLKKFKIDVIPGTKNYKISFISENPLLTSAEIKRYLDFANHRALTEVREISKKEHERNAALIQQEVNLAKQIAKANTKSQLVVLEEALDIAQSSGIEKPVKNKQVTDTFDPDPNHLYHNGAKGLKALMNNLSKRTNHEAFIPNLASMTERHDFYQNYQLKAQQTMLYHIDGDNIPAFLISFSKIEMTMTSLFLGLLLSIIIVLAQYFVFTNRELHSWKKEELV